MISVSSEQDADILSITASGLEPTRVADAANAVAHAYIDNREAAARGDLQRVSDELKTRLTDLQAQIADYDAKIGDGGLAPGATPTVVAPTAPTTEGPTPPDIESGTPANVEAPTAPATTDEGLKAARYAAAVQYQNVFARQQDIEVQLSLKKGAASMLTEAGVPGAPVGSSLVKDVVLAAIVGLMLGLGVAFLREQLDDRIRSREELESATGLPALGELPHDPNSVKDPTYLGTVQQPLGGLAEATRALRTSIGFLGIEEPVQRIVVTSPSPGDGKTLVAANLAAAYAQAGFLTVLVSADLRRPRLEEIFGYGGTEQEGLTGMVAAQPAPARSRQIRARNGNGTTNGNGSEHHGSRFPEPITVYREFLTFEDALVPTGVEDLWLLPAGALPPNPAEMLSSKRTQDVLDKLARDVDVVIIDSPPVLAVTDAVVLADHSDGVVLVASLAETRRGAIRRAAQTLDAPGIRVLGTVINKSKGTDPYRYYGYSYTQAEPSRRARSKQAKADKKASKADLKASRRAEKAGAAR